MTINKKIPAAYWIFIVLLQAALIFLKLTTEGFVIWNIVGLITAVFFVYSRLSKGKVILSGEMTITGFIAINGTMTFIGQMLRLENPIFAIGSIIVALISFYMFYYIWKVEKSARS